MVSPAEARAMLGVGDAVWERLVQSGRIPVVQLSPRCVRVPKAAIESLVREATARSMDYS
ncbi:MAG: helix-turn-helix transcriptional regulator [Dehalococcoidia bacterium]